jgi:Flp pilus assembly pilin Flp
MMDCLQAFLMQVRELRTREEGQAAVEYGVLVALIIAVSVVVSGAFQDVVDAL